jgi:hypothetical protein
MRKRRNRMDARALEWEMGRRGPFKPAYNRDVLVSFEGYEVPMNRLIGLSRRLARNYRRFLA